MHPAIRNITFTPTGATARELAAIRARKGESRPGDVRVNATDYGAGRIVVEQFCGVIGWAVPAWDERGEPDLAGDLPCDEFGAVGFSSVEAAQKAVDAYLGGA